jgi:DNA repair protein RecN (Recombination protein N)
MPELAARRDALGAELERLRGAGERCATLAAERAAALADWREAARALTQARTAAAFRLADAVGGCCRNWACRQRVRSGTAAAGEQAPSANGAERCEFLVSANPGQPPRPLRKVASGGELARISLAIEVAALGMDAVPTMVFDEVDSASAAPVAEVVGQKLRALGRRAPGVVRDAPCHRSPRRATSTCR